MKNFLEREQRKLITNERIERERNFAINLLKMQERKERTHEPTERMRTLDRKLVSGFSKSY